MAGRRERSAAATGRTLAPPPAEVHPRPEAPAPRSQKRLAAGDVRTVALCGHRGAGKTTLAERLLEEGRVVREAGSVQAGTTLLDASPACRALRQTVELSTAWIEWGDLVVQLVDTPGAAGLAEVRDLGVGASDLAVLVVDAASGLQVGGEDAWRSAEQASLPMLVVLSKVDRPASDVAAALRSLAAFAQGRDPGCRPVLLHLPFRGDDGELVGLVDVLGGVAHRFADDGSGASSPEPVPASLALQLGAAREQLAEAVALTDDALLERYLEFLELPMDVVAARLPVAVARRQVVPVLISAAERRIGPRALLDACAAFAPAYPSAPRWIVGPDGEQRPLDPSGPFVAEVVARSRDADGAPFSVLRVLAGDRAPANWVCGATGVKHRVQRLYRLRGPRRATAPPIVPGLLVATWDPLPVGVGGLVTAGEPAVLALARARPAMVERVVSSTDVRKESIVDGVIAELVQRDRGLSVRIDPHTGARLLGGQDEVQVDLAISDLREWVARVDSAVRLVTGLPPVGFVEAPLESASGVGEHRVEGADGLPTEFAKVEVVVEPRWDGSIEVVDAIGDDEWDLPARFRPAVEAGVRQGLRSGPTGRHPVAGVGVTLVGGAYDILQSTDEHFRAAGELAVRDALQRAGTRVLEPWCRVRVSLPESAVGELVADVSAHRGRILGLGVDGDRTWVEAYCPYRELRTFGGRLRALSRGRGTFELGETSHEPLPDALLREAIEAGTQRLPRNPAGR